MWYGHGMGMYGGGMILWGILTLLLVAAVIGLVVWAVTATTRSRDRGPVPPAPTPHVGAPVPGPLPGPTPEDILRRRYAAGEIDDEEFQRRMRVLGN